MQILNYLSTKSKLIIMLLLVTLCTTAIMVYLGLRTSRDALIEASFKELISVRSSKGDQIESFFHNLEHEAQTLAEQESIIHAMIHLNSEFKQLERQMIEQKWITSVEGFYTDTFFPELEKHLSGQPSLEFYAPKRPAVTYLQHHYIANNRNPLGEKHLLDNANDGSGYSLWHERYHPFLRNVLERFGYYDIFLIDYDTGDIVYTVYKEVDYGTNLISGPYSKSGLAEAVAAARWNPKLGEVQATDFQPYVPSYKAPAAFFATPIHNGPHIIGILAIQLPVDNINKITTGDQNWEADGLGHTGETYLVGPDLTMRSNSRFLIEDNEGYLQTMKSVGTDPRTLVSIEHFKTSILFQAVETNSAKAAILAGETGIEIVDDYRGEPVLSAYAPLKIPGLEWGILTDIEVQEVMEPVVAQQQLFLMAGAILMVLLAPLMILMSYYFVWPINFLIMQIEKIKVEEIKTEKIRANQYHVPEALQSADQYGQLSRSINEIVRNLHQKSQALEYERRRNDNLLLNILPQTIAERVKQGETEIVSQIQQTTILYVEIIGFTELAQVLGSEHASQQLNQFFGLLDSAAENIDIEIRPIIGGLFVATSGLTKPRLDHVKRALDFTLRVSSLLDQLNQEHNSDLQLKIGIHTGKVSAGLIGGQHFRYDMWGKDVEIASAIQRMAVPGVILVSQAVYEQVYEFYELVEHPPLLSEIDPPIRLWALDKVEMKIAP